MKEDVEMGVEFRRISGYWFRRTCVGYNLLFLFQFIIVSYAL
jgi:hypothetical protein